MDDSTQPPECQIGNDGNLAEAYRRGHVDENAPQFTLLREFVNIALDWSWNVKWSRRDDQEVFQQGLKRFLTERGTAE